MCAYVLMVELFMSVDRYIYRHSRKVKLAWLRWASRC